MNDIITRYQEYTGRTLTAEEVPVYTAWANRAVQILEDKLGWSLTEDSVVNIVGTSKHGCDCSEENDDFLPAPTIVGKAKIFTPNRNDKYLKIDPFTSIHKVYSCRIKTTESASANYGKTVVILEEIKEFSPRYFDTKFGKYIDACNSQHCIRTCSSGCRNCSAILVDADWVKINNAPASLLCLVFDYLNWMAEGGYSQSGISKESVDGHSVEYSNPIRSKTPLDDAANMAIISRFAGPYGDAGSKLIK